MFYEGGRAEELQFRAPIHAGASCFIRVEGLKNCRGSGLRVVCLSFGL